MTRTAGHASFARAVCIEGVEQLACAMLIMKRPMHQRCTTSHEDPSASPGAEGV
jgi:hypothetical protein